MKKFNKKAPTPKFNGDWEKRRSQYGNGLTIIRADQCPYTVKNVKEISETAEETYGIKPNILDLKIIVDTDITQKNLNPSESE